MKRYFSVSHFFSVALFLATAVFAQDLGQDVFITVDQFGYRPSDEKVAVLRDPQTGFDASLSYTPGTAINVVDASTNKVVYSSVAVAHDGGAVDTTSGDKVWWFDFSKVTTPGTYYIQDGSDASKKSFTFQIKEDVYNDVLKAAVRMLYYQRVTTAKEAQYAGAEWADEINHPQDKNARRFVDSTNVSAERDVSGGWFDAGDYNKYTVWNGNYIETLLQAYWERPKAFTDDYNIPESGNGIPDIVDEAKWGLDHLLRMQNEDGSVLSVVGESHDNASGGAATPPSTAVGRTYYGDANALSAYSAAKAFAIGAKVSKYFWGEEYTSKLTNAAIKAFNWAEAHPDSLFFNNDASHGTSGLAAGQQEENITDSDKTTTSVRLGYRLAAALRLFDLTGKASYLKIWIETNRYNSEKKNYQAFPLMNQWWRGDQYRHAHHRMFLLYLSLKGTKSALDETDFAAVVKAIQDGFLGLLEKNDFTGGPNKDGYRSYIRDYGWGSNSAKSSNGVLFELLSEANIPGIDKDYYYNYAEDYVHYIHGVNPFGYVYLSNMASYGASKSVPGIYHEWFHVSSDKWAFAKEGSVGPAPGYLTGGPNKDYKKNSCCSNGTYCGSQTTNYPLCFDQDVPSGEPQSKMYRNVTRGWPLDGYELTEPSLGYQTNFIHLLSKFVQEKGAGLGEIIEEPSSSSSDVESSASVESSAGEIVSSSSAEVVSSSDEAVSSAAEVSSSSEDSFSSSSAYAESSAAVSSSSVEAQSSSAEVASSSSDAYVESSSTWIYSSSSNLWEGIREAPLAGISVGISRNILTVRAPAGGRIDLQVFDLVGNAVMNRAGVANSGMVEMSLNNLPRGGYLVRISHGGYSKTARIQVR